MHQATFTPQQTEALRSEVANILGKEPPFTDAKMTEAYRSAAARLVMDCGRILSKSRFARLLSESGILSEAAAKAWCAAEVKAAKDQYHHKSHPPITAAAKAAIPEGWMALSSFAKLAGVDSHLLSVTKPERFKGMAQNIQVLPGIKSSHNGTPLRIVRRVWAEQHKDEVRAGLEALAAVKAKLGSYVSLQTPMELILDIAKPHWVTASSIAPQLATKIAALSSPPNKFLAFRPKEPNGRGLPIRLSNPLWLEYLLQQDKLLVGLTCATRTHTTHCGSHVVWVNTDVYKINEVKFWARLVELIEKPAAPEKTAAPSGDSGVMRISTEAHKLSKDKPWSRLVEKLAAPEGKPLVDVFAAKEKPTEAQPAAPPKPASLKESIKVWATGKTLTDAQPPMPQPSSLSGGCPPKPAAPGADSDGATAVLSALEHYAKGDRKKYLAALAWVFSTFRSSSTNTAQGSDSFFIEHAVSIAKLLTGPTDISDAATRIFAEVRVGATTPSVATSLLSALLAALP